MSSARRAASAPSFATQCLHDRRGESRGMARVRRSYEVAIDYDRRIVHPGCTGGFSVGLHDQFGVRRAVIEPRHAAASNDLRAGGQHRPSADASDHSTSSADVLYELGYARIFGKQGRAFCTPGNEDAHIVLGTGFHYRTVNIQQAGSREIAVNLDRLLARGYHLDLVASLIEGDLGKEVLLLLKCIGDQSGNLWASVGHCLVSYVLCRFEQSIPPFLEWGGRALDLGIALNTSAIAILVPAEAPVTIARLSTNSATQSRLSIVSARNADRRLVRYWLWGDPARCQQRSINMESPNS